MSASEDERSHRDENLSNRVEHVMSDTSENSEFSGFDKVPEVAHEEIVKTTVNENPKNDKKSKTKKKEKQEKPKKTVTKKRVKSKNKSGIDIDNLSESDLVALRRKLLLDKPQKEKETRQKSNIQSFFEEEDDFVPDYHDYDEDENSNLISKEDYRNGRNMRIEIDRQDLSDSGSDCQVRVNNSKNKNLSKSMIDAMFNDSDTENNTVPDDEWAMPQLKAVQKGKCINSSLAKLINTACTSPCETENLLQKFPIPENCDMLPAPLVNAEVWKILDRKARSYDQLFGQIQNLLAAGMVPIIKLIDIVKDMAKNDKAKELVSESLTLLGQVQYQLSLRRRYLIRPSLKKKYKNLCNQSTPVSSKLFGDDIAKEIKNCEAVSSIALSRFENEARPFRGRSMYRGSRGRGRFHPYNRSYQSEFPGRSDNFRQRNFIRGRRRPSATVTYNQGTRDAPNE